MRFYRIETTHTIISSFKVAKKAFHEKKNGSYESLTRILFTSRIYNDHERL